TANSSDSERDRNGRNAQRPSHTFRPLMLAIVARGANAPMTRTSLPNDESVPKQSLDRTPCGAMLACPLQPAAAGRGKACFRLLAQRQTTTPRRLFAATFRTTPRGVRS